MTPERLAELRQRAKWLLTAEPSDSAPTLDPKMSVFAADVVELVQAADNLNALLAAAEAVVVRSREIEWTNQNEGGMRMRAMESTVEDIVALRAAIRRAKGEKP